MSRIVASCGGAPTSPKIVGCKVREEAIALSKRSSRKLAVILHADVAGSTALVRANESTAHERIQECFRRLGHTVETYGGKTLELRGDALVAEFSRASDAVSAALAFQAENARLDAARDGELPLQLRIGIGLGEVVIADNTVTGTGVVLAQRLEQLAEPGGVSLHGAVYETVPRWLPFAYRSVGERQLKGFAEPVRIYAVTVQAGEAIPPFEPIAATEYASTQKLPDKPAVAVLPFANMSGDPEQEYFSDGITEDIITDLSRFREIFVIARNSSFAFKGQSIDVTEIARTLGVNYVVEGSVRKAENRVRITVQLIDATMGEHLWASRYERDLEDIFAVQDEVCETVVATLAGRLVEIRGERAKHRLPESLTAYDLLIAGRARLSRFARDDVAEARKLLQRSLEVDPDCAMTYALLAHTYWTDWWAGWATDPKECARLFADAADRAVLVDDTDAQAEGEKGFRELFRRQYEAAKYHVEKGVRLNPNGTDNLIFLSWCCMFTGKAEASLRHLDRAQRLDPFGRYGFIRGLVHYSLRQYGEAIAALSTLRLRIPALHAWLAASYAQSGRPEDARAEARHFVETVEAAMIEAGAPLPASWVEWFRLRLPYADEGDLEHVLEGMRKAGLA